MGAHHARVIAQSGEAELAYVIDPERSRAEDLTKRFGGEPAADAADIGDCQGAVVAAPTQTHLPAVATLLDRGIPALVEKPLSEDVDQVRAMLAKSEQSGVPITCGFVERFNPVIVAARKMLEGVPLHLLFLRHSPPAPRIQTSVVHDLLIHDIDLAVQICGERAHVASAAGWHPQGSAQLEIVDSTIVFGGTSVATLSADRWGQRKVRFVSISTDKALLELDLVRQTITVYRHVSHELRGDEPTYRAETMMDIPFVRHSGEPLVLQFDHFLGLIEGTADAAEERRSLLPAHELAAEIQESASGS